MSDAPEDGPIDEDAARRREEAEADAADRVAEAEAADRVAEADAVAAGSAAERAVPGPAEARAGSAPRPTGLGAWSAVLERHEIAVVGFLACAILVIGLWSYQLIDP